MHFYASEEKICLGLRDNTICSGGSLRPYILFCGK